MIKKSSNCWTASFIYRSHNEQHTCGKQCCLPQHCFQVALKETHAYLPVINSLHKFSCRISPDVLFFPFSQRNYKLQKLSQHALIWTQAIICGTYRYQNLISAMKRLLYHHKPKEMWCQCQTLKAVWNRSIGPEYITGCSPVLPAFFPGLTDSLTFYSGSTVCRACRSPVACWLVLHSALVTEPMILLGWQFRKSSLIVVSHGTWMLLFSWVISHMSISGSWTFHFLDIWYRIMSYNGIK